MSWRRALANEAVEFLSVDEAIAIQDLLVEQFGGQRGVRDEGMLEASLYRPQTGGYSDLAAMAAALFDALLFNHAFHSANRRIAFFATDVFLRINGYRLDVDAGDASRFIENLVGHDHAHRAALLPLLRRSIIVI
ncbi:MAG: type II toxin-antitoxin system death-on-curing family toxin [Gammaproteobacteria bacterium]|nr:type II toxin-antitoxin system death-on-curing family toxin [Gammaproteobacteria bacterium]